MEVVGKSKVRRDAWAKACGKAKYTDDYFLPGMLHAKLYHSSVASGKVVSIDVSEATALPGVRAVFTYEDVPDILYPTAGHPYTLDPSSGDVADRKILTGQIRYWGDEVAVVVAETEFIAEQAVKLIRVVVEDEPPILTGRDAIKEGQREIHENSNNIVQKTVRNSGDPDNAIANSSLIYESEYSTQIVQHCALENHTAIAYIGEDRRIVIVSSTQIPHICRRITAQALGLPLGKIRVIKPFVGGGFGSKQEVILEPLVAFLTTKLNGSPVRLRYTREETFSNTRTRNPISYHIRAGVDIDGKLTGWDCKAIAAGGGYASHGHSIMGRGWGKIHSLYPVDHYRYEACYTYTNTPVGGAMRAYGTPQIMFMLESLMDDLAYAIGMDPLKFRLNNIIGRDYVIPSTGLISTTYGIDQCIEKGAEAIQWENKQRINRLFNEKQKVSNGVKRRGVGMALISYNPFAWPGCQEIAGARLTLNQDGTIIMQVGAAEIGQGSDTVLSQIAAETLNVPFDRIIPVSTQDTDVTPFDLGAYSSRQTYVSGEAVKLAAIELRRKILDYAQTLTGLSPEKMDIVNGNLVDSEKHPLVSLEELALNSYYNREVANVLTADISHHLKSNCLISGACFAQVEVDISLCKVKVLEIYDVMDCGRIINPALAEGQIHGCVSMGLGYSLSEILMVDGTSGQVLNNNLLDYKLQTTMDTPDINVLFVEEPDPTGPYGNKGLGEPPTAPVAPAIRNAILAATGVKINNLPLRPQNLFEHFKREALI